MLGRAGVRVERYVGEGANAVVFCAVWRGRRCAAKLTKGDGDDCAREVAVLGALRSPYIVALYGTVRAGRATALLMEYLPLGSLDDLFARTVLAEAQKRRFARDVCRGMAYLHAHRVVHRDLKPGNVLVVATDAAAPGAVCKLSDFGTARRDLAVSAATMTHNVGTPLYMAPEMLSARGHYTRTADVYSYGILLAALWNEEQPYAAHDYENAFQFISAVVNDGARPPLDADCPADWRALAERCWATDPAARPTFAQILSEIAPEQDAADGAGTAAEQPADTFVVVAPPAAPARWTRLRSESPSDAPSTADSPVPSEGGVSQGSSTDEHNTPPGNRRHNSTHSCSNGVEEDDETSDGSSVELNPLSS